MTCGCSQVSLVAELGFNLDAFAGMTCVPQRRWLIVVTMICGARTILGAMNESRTKFSRHVKQSLVQIMPLTHGVI